MEVPEKLLEKGKNILKKKCFVWFSPNYYEATKYLNRAGSLFKNLNKFREASEAYLLAHNAHLKDNDTYEASIALQNAGQCLHKDNNDTEAFQFYKRAYDLLKLENNHNETIKCALKCIELLDLNNSTRIELLYECISLTQIGDSYKYIEEIMHLLIDYMIRNKIIIKLCDIMKDIAINLYTKKLKSIANKICMNLVILELITNLKKNYYDTFCDFGFNISLEGKYVNEIINSLVNKNNDNLNELKLDTNVSNLYAPIRTLFIKFNISELNNSYYIYDYDLR